MGESDANRVTQILGERHPLVFIPTNEEEEAVELLRTCALSQGLDLKLWSVTEGLRDGYLSESPPIPETANPAGALVFLLRQEKPSVMLARDMVVHMRDERVLRAARELVQHNARTKGTLLLVDHVDEMPPVLEREAVRFELSLPDEEEIRSIILSTIKLENAQSPVTAKIAENVFDAMVRNLRGLPRRVVANIIHDAIRTDRKFDAQDASRALLRKRQALRCAGPLEFVEAPVDLNEIAGMKRLKHWLALRQEALSPRAAEFGITPPRGVLMLGVQGAGKSLCAKAIATAWRWPLCRLDVGVLYDKYIGESERRLREAFTQAEAVSPLVLWIDEIEKAFASAASRSTDGGLSQRMFGSLLTWMQEHRSAVFVVATANDIDALPPELLRKGRFDEIFFIDLPDDEVRRSIFEIHLRRRRKEPGEFELGRLARASQGFSGAEIEQAVISGLYRAFDAGRAMTTEDLLGAMAESPPLSVTMAERVASLRAWAVGRCAAAH